MIYNSHTMKVGKSYKINFKKDNLSVNVKFKDLNVLENSNSLYIFEYIGEHENIFANSKIENGFFLPEGIVDLLNIVEI
jgi:hypothetical protein